MTVARVVRNLKARGFYDLCTEIVERSHLSIEQIASDSHAKDVVPVRHECWASVCQRLEGNVSATARVFGVDHSSILHALQIEPREISSVLLDSSGVYEFHFVLGRTSQYGVVDRAAAAGRGRITWYETHDMARDAFDALCIEAIGAQRREVS